MIEGEYHYPGAWARLRSSFARRRAARWALRVLFLLYGAALFAPLIANDLPLVLKAVHVSAYEKARSELALVVAELSDRIAAGEAEFLANLSQESRIRTFDQALSSQHGAALLRIETLGRFSAPERRAQLERFEQELAESVRLARESSALAPALARERLLSARELCGPDGALSVEASELVPRLSFPALSRIGPFNATLMALWILVLALPLLKRTLPAGPRAAQIGIPLAAVLFGLGWQLVLEPQPALAGVKIKEGLSKGSIEPERILLAPLRFGYDESRMYERFRPPTWHKTSELDAFGRYVSGPRARTPGARAVEVRYGEAPLNSGLRHPLGTDSLGRDLLVRLLWGGRVSLTVGLLSAALVLLFGVFFGGLAGYLGGKVDFAISRLIEVFQSFPAFFLILTVVALIPEQSVHPMFSIVAVIGLVGWTGVARLVRAEILRVRELDYVLAARSLGLSRTRVLLHHVLPNCMGPVWVAGAFAVASGILIESAVSFLGFGVRQPFPSWGALINDTRLLEYWWIQVFPGALIFLTVVCYNLVGEGLRDALDPREVA